MAYTVGSTVPLGIDIKDPSGNLVDGGTVTITVTRPDGSLDGPNTITSSPTGIYGYDFVANQAGRHTTTWTVTGQNAGVFTDSFNVDQAVWTGLVGLQEARDELNQVADADDEELRNVILAATDMIEGYTRRRFLPRTVTSTFNGWDISDSIQLPDGTQSVSTVSELGNTLTFGSWVFDQSTAKVYKMWGLYTSGLWQYGVGNITVTYTIGSNTIPSDVRYAALALIDHLWAPQRGGVGVGGPVTEPSEGQPYLMPLLVREILDRYRRKVGMLKVS